MTALRVLAVPADCLEGEVVAALFFEDVRPLRGAAALLDWRLNGCLTQLLLSGELRGRVGEQVLVANNGKLLADRILFVGAGHWRELNAERYRELLRHLLNVCRQAGFVRLAIGLTAAAKMSPAAIEQEIARLLAESSGSVGECLLSFDDDNPASA